MIKRLALRLRVPSCSKQHQILDGTRFDRAERDAVIQGDEAALSSHCKRQQVYVRDLVVPQDTAPIDACFGSERHLIGPKLVIKIGTNLLKLVFDALESSRPQSAVAGQIENA